MNRRLGPIPPLLLPILVGWLATALIPIEHPSVVASVGALLAMAMPLVTVLAVLVLGLVLIRRRWVWAVVATLVALTPWIIVLDHISASGNDSGPGDTVRILVVNAREGQAEATRIVDQVRSLNTDILIVTELSGTLAHDLTVHGIDASLTAASVVTTTEARSGIGVYSRFTVTDVQRVEGTHWPAVRATVQLEEATFTVIAAHAVVPTPSGVGTWSRDLEAIRVASQQEGPVVVAGTLNATAWNPQFRDLVTTRLHDAAAVHGRGLRPTWPSWLPVPVTALDHVLVTGDIEVRSINSARIRGSDHRSLAAGLSVPRG
jgi:endonuclease/exonuclease/phosphatase (EEP) superfamily protein YafD